MRWTSTASPSARSLNDSGWRPSRSACCSRGARRTIRLRIARGASATHCGVFGMTCHDALERLLVADLSTDGSVDDPVLNSHLKHCAQCSAVASQLRSDTRLLAAAVVSPRELRSPVGAPRRLSFALPVLAVAAIAVFVVARSRPSDGSGTLVATSVAGAVADASERPAADRRGSAWRFAAVSERPTSRDICTTDAGIAPRRRRIAGR